MNERLQLAMAIAPTLIQLHPNGHLYADKPADVATAARRYADAILAEMAKAEPKATSQPDQAADDEAWLLALGGGMAVENGNWTVMTAVGFGDVWAEGPTIAAAIRALRVKVEGGAR